MPFVERVLSRRSRGQNVKPLVKNLHRELTLLSIPVAPAEITGKTFGATTEAGVRAFQRRVGLPETGTINKATGGIMALATLGAEEGDRVRLRQKLRSNLNRVPNSPEYAYWLARYAVIAGDYQTAKIAADRAPQLSGLITQIINPVRDPLGHPPRPPEVPFPENFYTYRYKLLSQETLDELLGSTDSIPPGSSARMMRRRLVGRDGEGDWPDLPDEPEPDPPPGDPAPNPQREAELIESAQSWLIAVNHWQFGNEEFNKRHYASAVSAYTACQKAALNYFALYYADVDFIDVLHLPPWPQKLSLEQQVRRYVIALATNETRWVFMWEAIRQRRLMLSLQELGDYDWAAVTPSAVSLLTVNLGGNEAANPELRQRSLDRPLLILATVMAPLARAEANRLRRQYDAAEQDLRGVLRPYQVPVGGTPPTVRDVWLTCDFIEIPFARLLLAETLLDKADAQYKARIHVADGDTTTLTALQNASVEYNNRLPNSDVRNQTEPFQLLQAAKTYLDVFELFEDEGEYVSRINQGLDNLRDEVSESLSQGDVTSNRFRAIGKEITIPTIEPIGETLPGIDRRIGPHEPLIKFESEQPMRETNPRVYSVLLEAQARLLQLWSWFNYLGYPDDYVPPWRFQFLLERARYFAEHAKNAQRDYLNFLSNAEHEEFQELSAAQNVELEKSNVIIETARVDQVKFEWVAAFQSATLASMTALNAQARLERYTRFDQQADELVGTGLLGFMWGSMLSQLPEPFSEAVGYVYDVFTGGASSKALDRRIAALQRGYEKFSLSLAAQEAGQAEVVAQSQLAVARAGLLVASLQRQAALLRHEFALQNLNFLRNRILNSEQWYRLAGAIRSVSETYMRYAIELSFLAEQAYEFEADKIINVIRFDYDQSETGNFLAADFLLRDLDTLEQDLIVNQRLRQQQVRYVLSMAREFPETLQELRENGLTTVSLPLEQLERRFPGIYNLRIGAVDVLPIALMDSARFSLELTYCGSSQVRLKSPPGPAGDWTILPRVRGPETVVYSGLSRQEASAVFPFATSGQRNAFEGLGAASGWQIDMSMPENQIVPGTLADMLITFTLSGYHDATLHAQQLEQAPRTNVLTTWLSGRQSFADAFYEFNQTGRMEWQVTDDVLTLKESVGKLRNLALILTPAPTRIQFGRIRCGYAVDFRVTESGEVQTDRPQVTFELTVPLTLTARAVVPDGAIVSWDFGDDTGWQGGSEITHTYARPGSYEATLRMVQSDRLSEYKAAVVVSRTSELLPPLATFPSLSRDTSATDVPAGRVRVAASIVQPAGETLTAHWRLNNGEVLKGESISFDLEPGTYTLWFAATRSLQARVYGTQRFLPEQTLAMSGLGLASNRRFDADGNETTGIEPNPPANSLTSHLFPPETEISPADVWVLELTSSDNPCLRSVSSTDIEQLALGEIQDAILALEFETKLDLGAV